MIKLFTDNDLDGVGCAILGLLAFKELSIEYCGYNNINEKLIEFIKNDNDTFIYITDLSVNDEVAQMLEKRGKVCLIDHHKTALELNKYNFASVIVEIDGVLQCGTSLFYDYLIDSRPFESKIGIINFVENVRLYDTWDWKKFNKQTPKDLNDILKIIGITDFIDTMINNSFELTKLDKTMLKYRRNEIDEFIKRKLKTVKYTDFQGFKIASVLCDTYAYTSELGNKMCEVLDIDIAFLIYDGGVALRSLGDIDVSVIAKHFGGGGHKNAAGFKINTDFSKLLNLEN